MHLSWKVAAPGGKMTIFACFGSESVLELQRNERQGQRQTDTIRRENNKVPSMTS
jgi:hypothetical protein